MCRDRDIPIDSHLGTFLSIVRFPFEQFVSGISDMDVQSLERNDGDSFVFKAEQSDSLTLLVCSILFAVVTVSPNRQ